MVANTSVAPDSQCNYLVAYSCGMSNTDSHDCDSCDTDSWDTDAYDTDSWDTGVYDTDSDDLSPPDGGDEAIATIDVPVDVERVWQALTEDNELGDWLGDGSTIGADVGEELLINDLVTGRKRVGVLDEVTRHRRLAYTWWPETDPKTPTRVAITLDPLPEGTRVTVVETLPGQAYAMAGRHRVVAGGLSVDWQWRLALVALRLAPSWAAVAGQRC